MLFNATRRTAMADQPAPTQTLYTVNQLAAVEPALTPGGIRFDLFNRKSNGLEASGALIRRGRRILIHREKYFSWLASAGA